MTDRTMPPRVPNPRGRGRVGVREVAPARRRLDADRVPRAQRLRERARGHPATGCSTPWPQLDYRPNNAARSLGTARTRILGVVATDVTLFGPSAAIAALAGAARERGRWLSTAYADADDEESVDSAVSHVLGQGVDGIVLVAPHARTRDALLGRALDVPIVIMHGGPSTGSPRGSRSSSSTWWPRPPAHRPARRSAGLDRGVVPTVGFERRPDRARAGRGAELGRGLVGRGGRRRADRHR